MLQAAMQQIDFPIILAGQFMPKHPCDNERSNRSDRVGKKRVRPIERMNKPRITPIGMIFADPRESKSTAPPARPRCLERQFVRRQLPRIMRNPFFPHQSAEVAIGADIVEAMIVHANMADVFGHVLERYCSAADFKKLAIIGCVESQQRQPY